MTIEEINALLARVLPLRPPRFPPNTSGGAKVAAIEDHMLAMAYEHSELREALHWLDAVIERCTEQIGEITGYEALLRKPKGRETAADVLAAKRLACPQPFLAGVEAKRLKATVLSQISRFQLEYDIISRAYTVIAS